MLRWFQDPPRLFARAVASIHEGRGFPPPPWLALVLPFLRAMARGAVAQISARRGI